MVPDSPFDIPASPICSPIPTQDVIPPSFSCYTQHEPDLDLFTIPDSPNIFPVDRTGGNISESPIVPSGSIPAGQDSIQFRQTDIVDIPDSPPSPIEDFGSIPASSPIDDFNFIPACQDSIRFLQTELFDIPNLPPSPIDDLMDVCAIPPSPILAAGVHPEIPHASLDAGSSTVDPQLQDENTAEHRSLRTLRKNLIPYLPVILSWASLLRAQLSQLITERDFIKGQIDGAVTRIAEVDRYLYGLRALQLMRQEGPSEETGM